jgi:hypothetical protein
MSLQPDGVVYVRDGVDFGETCRTPARVGDRVGDADTPMGARHVRGERVRTVVLVAVVALVSCGDGARSGSPTDVSTSTSAGCHAEPTLSVDGPVMRYPVPSCNTDGM